MNNIMGKIDKYLVLNKLQLNISKTKAMVITKYKFNNIDVHILEFDIDVLDRFDNWFI